ncbi:MAG: undecaprenyl-diphosphate phosphatase [Gammaproteobacteria bacterium]|nr:undecaprenyl-diphosphate phosphatase [Gammaproteobacteria bacterium]
MDSLHAIYLAVLQGFTEFLPISSSGHLILIPSLLGWEDQGLPFDVAVHVGSLVAVVTYFRHELRRMARDWINSCKQFKPVGDSRLAWAMIWGSIPVALAGLSLNAIIEEQMRSPLVIGLTTIGFGVLLGMADFKGFKERDESTLNWNDVMLIGLAQAVALIPGTSRSGITITAGLMLGLTRQGAARFSFLLSIPVIIMAGGYQTLVLYQSPEVIDWNILLLGIAVSAVTAYICIHYFLKMLESMGMLPFVIYRVILGGYLLFLYN